MVFSKPPFGLSLDSTCCHTPIGGEGHGLAEEGRAEVTESVTLGVSGMTCDSCRMGVERRLRSQVGIYI